MENFYNIIMCFLTLGYLIATVYLARIGRKQSQIASDSLKMLAIAEHDRKRPYLMFSLVSREMTIYAELRNYGLSPACKIKISIDDACKKGLWEPLGYIDTGVTMLGPKGVYSIPIGWLTDLHDANHDMIFQGEINYESTKENGCEHFKESFQHDLSYASKIHSVETTRNGKSASIDAKVIADEIRNLRGEQSF